MMRILSTATLIGLSSTAALAHPGHGAALGHVHWSTWAAVAAVIAAPFAIRMLRKH